MVARELSIAEWRAMHTPDVIGSGSAANVCGVGYGSPLAEWAERTGRVDSIDISDEDPVWLGREMESTVLRFHAKKSGVKLLDFSDEQAREQVEQRLTASGKCEVLGWVEHRQPYVRSTRYPWMVATLDGIGKIDGRVRTIEAKYPGLRQITKWTEGTAPDAYRLQVQHTLITLGSITDGDLVALLGHDYRCVSVSLGETNVDAIVALERHFLDCLERDQEPMIDTSPTAVEAFKALHPADNGKSIVLPIEAIALHKTLAELQAKAKTIAAQLSPIEDDIEGVKSRLKQLIGDHTWGVLPDGSARYSLKTTTRKPSAGSTFRTLRLEAK